MIITSEGEDKGEDGREEGLERDGEDEGRRKRQKRKEKEKRWVTASHLNRAITRSKGAKNKIKRIQ